MIINNTTESAYMNEALNLAITAADCGETPVGAIVVRNSDGKIIGKGYNKREIGKNSILHAEMIAINDACKTLGGWRLSGCTLFVTLEPCPMCAGAIINSRIDHVVFGAYDEKAGSVGSIVNLFELNYNHKPTYSGGILQGECTALLQAFFKRIRQRNKERDLKLIQVESDEQIIKVASLADEIWHEWFPSIISGGQIDYMLNKFQSVESITEQINSNGYFYFIMRKNDNFIGYIAIHPQDDNRLFLSKIYIKKAYRGMGYSRQAFDFLREYCKENGLNKIWLTVNKYNSSTIDIYKKIGFEIIGEGVNEIGNGYVMDDYYLELAI